MKAETTVEQSGVPPESVIDNTHIVLFDGTCNLCSWTLLFVFRNDHRSLYRFAWVQSEEGGEILKWCGLPADQFDTMVTIEQGKAYFKSEAFLRVARHLRFPWSLLWPGIVIPSFIRDAVYDFLARQRFRLFGVRELCLIPEGAIGERFIRRRKRVGARPSAFAFILSFCWAVPYI